jgi:hypothetical protein
VTYLHRHQGLQALYIDAILLWDTSSEVHNLTNLHQQRLVQAGPRRAAVAEGCGPQGRPVQASAGQGHRVGTVTKSGLLVTSSAARATGRLDGPAIPAAVPAVPCAPACLLLFMLVFWNTTQPAAPTLDWLQRVESTYTQSPRRAVLLWKATPER